MQKIKQQTVYIETVVKERKDFPVVDEWSMVLFDNGEVRKYDDEKWPFAEATHILSKKEQQVVISVEEFESAIIDAYQQAGS